MIAAIRREADELIDLTLLLAFACACSFPVGFMVFAATFSERKEFIPAWQELRHAVIWGYLAFQVSLSVVLLVAGKHPLKRIVRTPEPTAHELNLERVKQLPPDDPYHKPFALTAEKVRTPLDNWRIFGKKKIEPVLWALYHLGEDDYISNNNLENLLTRSEVSRLQEVLHQRGMSDTRNKSEQLNARGRAELAILLPYCGRDPQTGELFRTHTPHTTHTD